MAKVAKKPSTKSTASEKICKVGRRKSSSARVFLSPGKGELTINGRSLDKYFGRATSRIKVIRPLEVAGIKSVDLYITTKGGGNTGQAGAIALGIARALIVYDETTRPVLKAAGLLTRDARKVERKKYAHKKARKSEQYSKR